MREFVVSTRVVLYKDETVEADSLEDALRLATKEANKLVELTTIELEHKFIDSEVRIIGVMEKL